MAPLWTPHLKLAIGGLLGGDPGEIWSNTLRFNLPNPIPDRGQLVTANDALELALAAWFGGTDALISKAAEITWSKLNWILSDGKQRDSDTVVHDFSTPTRGAITAVQPPFYQTQAITFRTAKKRGRSHSGRIFPPMTTFTPDGLYSPYQSIAQATAQASHFSDMVNAVQDSLGASFSAFGGLRPDLAVFSPGNTVGPIPPLWQLVTNFVVDTVPDVQHRRTNRIPRREGGSAPI